jgi:hypothetical protein
MSLLESMILIGQQPTQGEQMLRSILNVPLRDQNYHQVLMTFGIPEGEKMTVKRQEAWMEVP